MKNHQLFVLPILSLIGGCATTFDQNYAADADKVAAYPLTHRSEFERLDLAEVIANELPGDRCEKTLPRRSKAVLQEDFDPNFVGTRADRALGCFSDWADTQPGRAQERRNHIQERLLAASEQRCGDFKALLQRKQSDTGFITGLLTAGFSAAGAITKSIEGARTLAGLSGFSSAFGAEYNQAYFSNLAAHVVIAGIDSQRSRIYTQMVEAGQRKPITDYPLQQAIKDAMRYHAACNIMVGFIEAQDAIRTVENPGLDVLKRAIVKNKHIQQLNQAEPKDIPKLVADWKDILPADKWLAGVPTASTGSPRTNTASEGAMALELALIETKKLTPVIKKRGLAIAENLDGTLKESGKSEAEKAAGVLGALATKTVEQIEACRGPVKAQAIELIDLEAKQSVEQTDQTRDKRSIDIRYANMRSDALVRAIASLGDPLRSCDATLFKALDAIQTEIAAKDIAKQKLALGGFSKAYGECPLPSALQYGKLCPKPAD